MTDGMNDKGFSLVELIIVIAIMAVLISTLAPQYVKFATNARVTADMSNATEIAKAFEASIANVNAVPVPEEVIGVGGTAVSNVPGVAQLPYSRVDSTYQWHIKSSNITGIVEITLNGYVIYPDAYGSNGYHTHCYVN